MSVPPQCQHDKEKTVYDLRFCMMTHEESHVVRWLKNGTFMPDIRLGCPSICKKGCRAHSLGVFLAPRHFFSFWTVCVSFDRSHF